MSGHKKTYSELEQLDTFEERFKYCQCHGSIGVSTFGASRYLNQMLYSSYYWTHDVRDKIIERDNGCDLGVPGYEIMDKREATVHHLNPITVEQVLNHDPCVFDLNNLILCRSSTHKLIHYGSNPPERRDPIERRPHDTCPWRK